jgi:5-methylcytosine-specific restriction endonuclease McrA
MHEPRDFSFLQRDELWDDDEDIKQKIHHLIANGEDVLVSLEHKVKRSAYLIDEERKRRSAESFCTLTSAENMRVRKLRAQRLDHLLRPYWEWLLKQLGNECQICHRVFNLTDLHVDHCRPLSRGGKNEWDNIQPTCRSCNSRKNAKTFISDAVLSAQKEWKKLNRRSNARKSRQQTIEHGQVCGVQNPD